MKLIKSKGLKVPRKSKEAPLPSVTNEGFSELDCYEALLDVEQWLGAFLSDTFSPMQKTAKGKSRRKTITRPQQNSLHGGPESAGEVVQYGVKKGWISATVLY
jgi:serine/threonine-protein kinase haspin